MKNCIILILLLLMSTFLFSQTKIQQFYDKSDALFGRYVSNGKIDYATIKKNHQGLNDLMALAKDIRVEKSNAKIYHLK